MVVMSGEECAPVILLRLDSLLKTGLTLFSNLAISRWIQKKLKENCIKMFKKDQVERN